MFCLATEGTEIAERRSRNQTAATLQRRESFRLLSVAFLKGDQGGCRAALLLSLFDFRLPHPNFPRSGFRPAMTGWGRMKRGKIIPTSWKLAVLGYRSKITAVLNKTFNRLCEGATATAAIFSGRQSRSPSVRRDELLAVDCFVVPPRKDGGVEVSIKTGRFFPMLLTLTAIFLEGLRTTVIENDNLCELCGRENRSHANKRSYLT